MLLLKVRKLTVTVSNSPTYIILNVLGERRTVGGSMRLCRFLAGSNSNKKGRRLLSRENHGNASTKMAAKSRALKSSSCFNLLFYILVFTLTNSLENAPSLTSNATLLGGSNVTYNDTDDYTLNESTTQPSDSNSSVQTALASASLPLSGRLPTPAANGKVSFKRI